MSHALCQLGGFIFDPKVQKRSPPNANILKTNHLFKAQEIVKQGEKYDFPRFQELQSEGNHNNKWTTVSNAKQQADP